MPRIGPTGAGSALGCATGARRVEAGDTWLCSKIDIQNASEGRLFKACYDIALESMSDDCGLPTAEIEFSFDDGATEGATADKWVNRQFTTLFAEPDDYNLSVHATTADGVMSPLEATPTFETIE